MKVKKGMQFHHVYCDGNCLWEVKSRHAGDVWRCEIVNDSDYGGHVDVFTEKQILAWVEQADAYKNIADTNDAYYASLKPGQIVHYNNGLREFVRCEVVNDKGANKLKPIALVGEWRDYDLPHYHPIRYEEVIPYHVKGINEGNLFTPHYSNIFEAPCRYHQDGEYNPTNLPAIDLKLPPLTAHQVETRDLWREVENVGNFVRQPPREMKPSEILEHVRSMVNEALGNL